VSEAATVCDEFKTKPRSGFGLNELLGRTLARKVSARQCCSLAEVRTAGARLAELRAHPENHGMEPTDSGVLELRAYPRVARARRENAAEGINKRNQPCQHSPETTPNAFDLLRPNA